ncbi:MAG TPA: tetratricopeptide repeat protein [Geminicoccaceae bacterium]|nr:tetratricopeptide repeat protein [Geminicoccaceae bacterium]
MLDLTGTISIIGRLSAPTEVVAREVAARGGKLQRGLSRRTGVVVVARRSARLLAGGRLQAKIAQADRQGAVCIGETALLRAVGLLPSAAPVAGAVALDALAEKAGLDAEVVRLLLLFDLIEPQDGQCSFRDLLSAREVARLLREGLDLAAILGTAERMTRRSPGAQHHPLTRLKLVGDGMGQLARRIDGALVEVDGQMRLPLPRTENPSVDELFEHAEEAEQAGDLVAAEALYRRCVALDRSDPIALFNLANVLCAQDRGVAAKPYLQLAAALDPGLAEAWYNLALLLEAEGNASGARQSFERAIAADPDYADPLYNLAQLEFEAGAFGKARDLWQRYLMLDPDSEWARNARRGLALCRRQAHSG